MKKKWKKEDLNSKHIEFSNKEEQNKLIKFLNSFGLKEEFEKNRGENDNCFYVSGSSDFYFTDNVKECELKYSDIFPEESFKQEQQFIVGKWHKLPNNINKAGNVIIYIKLKNITSDGYQEYSHRIVNNKGYEEYHDEVKTKIELLTDLSEIQQYLPSNHPDKVNTASKQYQYEVVHCKTQQEWDFVCNTYNILKEIRFNIDTDSRGTANCINYNGKSWASLVWYQSENSLIYSFEEWCNKFNYKPDFMKKEESFAILLNSQEELDKCIEWAKNKGLVENGSNNSVFKKSEPYFRFEFKANYWYISSIAFGNPLKTLSDIGIVMNKEETMFKKGNYIVTLKGKFGGNCAKENYCFKQRINSNAIFPERDLSGNDSNGHAVMTFDKKEWLEDWRYATKEEIEHYNKINKPYDINTLPKKLNKEELLEKAKKDYPIGTKYKSLNRSETYISDGNARFIEKGIRGCSGEINIAVSNEGELKGLVYRDGIWATIIEQPLIKEEKWIPQVGEWAKCIGDNCRTKTGLYSSGWKKDLVFEITKITSGVLWKAHDGNGVWIEEGHVRKALPHEIPQESNSSIPTYVEWINNIGSRGQGLMGHESYFKQGKIFCTKTDNLPGCGLNSSPENWGKALTEYWYSRNFKPSTKEAYDWQNGVKEIFKHYENIQLYPVTKEQCYNGSSDIIEVGDEVEVINANSSNWYSNGVKYKVINVTNNGTRIHTDNDLSYWIQSNHCKVIKKASQIQHNERKVDEQLPNIAQNYEILDIFKPKSSKTMDFTAFQQQSPKELGKISKNKHLTI